MKRSLHFHRDCPKRQSRGEQALWKRAYQRHFSTPLRDTGKIRKKVYSTAHEPHNLQKSAATDGKCGACHTVPAQKYPLPRRDPDRETLNVLQTRDGADWFLDSSQNYWRVFPFIERSVCLEKVESEKDFYDSAVAFGNFQKQLADFPVEILHETIPNFHNTASRFADFQKAVAEGDQARIALAQAEIAFALDRKEDTSVLTTLLSEGKLPLRVTHNDTKLNNILFDADTHKALCIIDLDTVMPGLSLYDFGDSIRFGANTGAEDETDLSKVGLDLSLFEAFTKGYLEGCAGRLTAKETELLPMGAKLMTYECGIRFLADFLTGDHYFKIHRDHHNLDRARTQFQLVADMEAKWQDMTAIVKNIQIPHKRLF